jgi:hypothetical protein
MRVYLFVLWTLVSGVLALASSVFLLRSMRSVFAPLSSGPLIVVSVLFAYPIMIPLVYAGVRVLKIRVARRDGRLVVVSLRDEERRKTQSQRAV